MLLILPPYTQILAHTRALYFSGMNEHRVPFIQKWHLSLMGVGPIGRCGMCSGIRPSMFLLVAQIHFSFLIGERE